MGFNTDDPGTSTTNAYDAIAGAYAEKYFSDTSDFEHIDPFITSLGKHANVLEAGCGAGQFSKYCIECGFRVTGIDISRKMLEQAKARVKNAEFIQMDMRKLTFPDGSFNGIIAPYSLIHIPSNEVESTLCGFHNVLTEKGKLCVIAQYGDPDHFIVEPLAPEHKIFFNFFTEERLRTFITRAGFSDVIINRIHSDDGYTLSDSILYAFAQKR